MNVFVLHLTDLHCVPANNSIDRKVEALSRCIDSQVVPGDCCIVAFTGDAADKGNIEEFVQAERILNSVIQPLIGRGVRIEKFAIPGNHDLMLAGDQEARDIVLEKITHKMPSPSVKSAAIAPLTSYFLFQDRFAPRSPTLSSGEPFFCTAVLEIGEWKIQVNSINSAWMGKRGDKPGAFHFPIDAIEVSNTSGITCVITLMHHPFNWFAQPDSMRPLRDKIEESTDLLLLGHEHSADEYSKSGKTLVHIVEGGVLQELSDPNLSTFNCVRLDLTGSTKTISCFEWRESTLGYELRSVSESTPLRRVLARATDALALDKSFEVYLDDIELPLYNASTAARGSNSLVHLSDVFTYPDLREYQAQKATGDFKHVRSEFVKEALAKESRVLLTGPEKSGKTSLAKRLFLDCRHAARTPVLLVSKNVGNRVTPKSLEQAFEKALAKQYTKLTAVGYWQLDINQRVLIFDDVHEMLSVLGNCNDIAEFLDRFGQVYFVGESELSLTSLRVRGQDALLLGFKRYHICEFGHLCLEELVRRWTHCACPETVSHAPEEVRRICSVVERVLNLNSIPHQPWILLVLIQESQSTDEPAAKNGSYGHLFEALITHALARSRLTTIDIRSKYTYLSELAFHMFDRSLATLDISQALAFHKGYNDKYDLSVDYEKIIGDLVDVGILRTEAGGIHFRAKYAYCFFVAWYLNHNIHRASVQAQFAEICRKIYHSEYANIIVFLSHLRHDPAVLQQIIAVANGLFADSPCADLGDHVKLLNYLIPEEFLKLTDTSPEETQRTIKSIKDEKLIVRDPSEMDGRAIKPRPDEDTDGELDERHGIREIVLEIRSTIKAIQILGQVLRNGAGAIAGPEKREIVETIYLLARRLIGFLFDELPDRMKAILEMYAEKYRNDNPIGEGVSDRDYNEALADSVGKQVFGTFWWATYSIVICVADSCGLELLESTFQKVLDADSSLPNRLFDLGVKLEQAGKFPKELSTSMYSDLSDNRFCQSLVKALVVRHLQLYKVPPQIKDSVCKRLGISTEKSKSTMNPNIKRLN